jgi:hypothetical protein
MGGEIVAEYSTAANGYVITITHYRDTFGVPLYTTIPVNIFQYDATVSDWIPFTFINIPLDVAASTALLPSFPYGIEVGVYRDTVPFPTGHYRILNGTCCRNGAIVNMAMPLNEELLLYTDLDVDALNNSTPNFLVMPVAYFPINQPATYNPLPYDIDGDSLSWNLNTPYTNYSLSPMALGTVGGFVAPSAAASGPFTMNPVTGEISWTPDNMGNYVQSFEVTEFKNGVAVGTIIRDMQYVIVDTNGNAAPNFMAQTPYNTNTTQNYNYLYYTPGQAVTFSIQGTDPDNNPMQMTAFSTTFMMPNPATFTSTTSGNTITGTFQWTPPANFVKDVIVVFRLGDGMFAKDFTLLLRKKDPTGITSVPSSLKNIAAFPNPAKDKLNVSLDLEKEIDGDISLYSIMGQKMHTIYSGKLPKGTTRLSDDIKLSSGMYYLVVKDNGRTVKTVSVAIQ